jgi:hypothetical protein
VPKGAKTERKSPGWAKGRCRSRGRREGWQKVLNRAGIARLGERTKQGENKGSEQKKLGRALGGDRKFELFLEIVGNTWLILLIREYMGFAFVANGGGYMFVMVGDCLSGVLA